MRACRAAIPLVSALDCAFNNAGIAATPVLLHQTPEAVFDRETAVDLKDAFLCLKHELAHMVGVGRGAIVNTASVAGLIPERGLASYVAAKHGSSATPIPRASTMRRGAFGSTRWRRDGCARP